MPFTVILLYEIPVFFRSPLIKIPEPFGLFRPAANPSVDEMKYNASVEEMK